MIGVKIESIDMREYGLILTYRKINAPKPKLYTLSVPGMNGVIDYTDFYGDVTFENRKIELKFQKKVSGDMVFLKQNIEKMNGKNVKIVFSDDPSHYWKGRLTIENNDDDTHIYQLEMTLDSFPFKFSLKNDVEVK